MPPPVVPPEENAVLAAIDSALGLAPKDVPPDLPENSNAKNEPAWHLFEHRAWEIGEAIRQALAAKPSLRKSAPIQRGLLAVADRRQLRRGRQSFFFGLSHVAAQPHADRVAAHLADEDVQGHALDALLKMRARGYSEGVRPLAGARHAWIRRLAKKYLEREANG